ncbi:alpha/beta fold hydrolase [Sanguibacter antarcticus]|uniref:Pimeloyl-ACP methyl ester carboxylesterase n=1 Tax=Sanguibacter antarcticus TaxID=372484 RepID=A0A2A9E344_9MICO|nr:alpha/beta hydrolase [Sanguibacter antarcticus]PFG32642.1 pimeloyl-ACP methyl ester carboxylesterase [Sanguibacter antarcticus]
MSSSSLDLHLYRVAPGGGACVVLLHGFPLDHRMWDDVAALLPADVSVVAPDLPGLGASPLDGEQPPSLEAAADEVAAAVRRGGFAEIVVVGLSMGGYVALALLERHPELVVGLVLVDTRSTPDTDETRARRLRIADDVVQTGALVPVSDASGLVGLTTRTGRPEVVARLEAWIREQSPEGVAWSQRAMASRPDRTSVLASFSGPSAVVVGDEDELAPPAAAEHMAVHLPDARVVLVPGSGHMSAVEAPVPVASAIADVVGRVRQRT